jgi:hypothetical protein
MKHHQFILRDPNYSSFYGLTQETVYQLIRPDLRADVLNQQLCGLVGTHFELRDLHISGDRYPSPLAWLMREYRFRAASELPTGKNAA